LTASQLRVQNGRVRLGTDNILGTSNDLAVISGVLDLASRSLTSGVDVITIGTGTTFSAATLTLNGGTIINGTNAAYTSININNGGVLDLDHGFLNTNATSANAIQINAG